MSKLIPWVEVLIRKENSYSDYKVIQSYPFPDAIFGDAVDFIAFTDLSTLKGWLDLIEDKQLKLSQIRRLGFITDIWHPTNFMQVRFKEWKYAK